MDNSTYLNYNLFKAIIPLQSYLKSIDFNQKWVSVCYIFESTVINKRAKEQPTLQLHSKMRIRDVENVYIQSKIT